MKMKEIFIVEVELWESKLIDCGVQEKQTNPLLKKYKYK